jgi:hypothetical protein
MKTVIMPDLSTPAHGFHHTLDSALEILAHLGVPFHRIDLRMEGAGHPNCAIISQSPKAGSALTNDIRVSLGVSGSSTFYDIPAGMWESKPEEEPSVDDIVRVFDDPLEKTASWIRKGSRLFEISPENAAACERWISLFGIRPEDWPSWLHYRLALLLPSLHRLAGTKNGVCFCFGFLLDLPIESFSHRATYLDLAASECSRLSADKQRVAMDLLVGTKIEGWRGLIVVLGPVPLSTFMEFRDASQARLLAAVADLCLPCYQPYRLEWKVLDSRFPVRLAHAHQNGLLAVNSYLGATPYELSRNSEEMSRPA